MAADATIRASHGDYQDPADAADLISLAREIAAQVSLSTFSDAFDAELIRRGDLDDAIAVQSALAALRWRLYAESGFNAQVTR